MYVCMYVCITHVFVYVCIYARMHWFVQTYIHIHIHAYIHTYTHIHTYVYTCLFSLLSMLWHRQAIFESKGDKLSSSAECRIRTRVSGTGSPADRMSASKPTELSTTIWWYTWVFLLIPMLWHRQAFSNRKETRCLSLLNAGFEPGSLEPPAGWMPADKPTELSRIIIHI